jgi:3-isopropylmalate dehydrogenase
MTKTGVPAPMIIEIAAGAADAIFPGAIGLPEIRHKDGTKILPHLRLRDRYQLYAGVQPVKAYPNAPMPLASPSASKIDLVIMLMLPRLILFAVPGLPMLW